jgi:hypothetical protein
MEKITWASYEARVQSSIHLVGLLSLTVGVIHGIASTAYWTEWWGFAAFFLLVGLAQVAAGLVIFMQPWRYDTTGGIREADTRYARPFFMAGIVFNGVLVVLWLASRLVRLPVAGLDVGMTLGLVTFLGVLASLIEVVIVSYLVRWVRMLDRLT